MTDRAAELLQRLKVSHGTEEPKAPRSVPPPNAGQMFLFGGVPPELQAVADGLKAIEPDELSPREAHDLLRALRNRIA